LSPPVLTLIAEDSDKTRRAKHYSWEEEEDSWYTSY
jgi:hypothetical protein